MANTNTHPEIGCYGDGALGHQNTREACRMTLGYYVLENFRSRGIPEPFAPGLWTVNALMISLLCDMPDDAWDEHAACEWLNEHAPFTGAHWGWQDGDFGLWPDDLA